MTMTVTVTDATVRDDSVDATVVSWTLTSSRLFEAVVDDERIDSVSVVAVVDDDKTIR